MPRGCFECPLREEHGWEGDWCAVSEGCDLIGETTRPDYCPLKSADEMTTYYTPCEDCHTKMDEVRRAYDNAMKQEPVIDKINKMKTEIADSLEFWDYSPNNNPLARDMLETFTNFWGDIKAESENS